MDIKATISGKYEYGAEIEDKNPAQQRAAIVDEIKQEVNCLFNGDVSVEVDIAGQVQNNEESRTDDPGDVEAGEGLPPAQSTHPSSDEEMRKGPKTTSPVPDPSDEEEDEELNG